MQASRYAPSPSANQKPATPSTAVSGATTTTATSSDIPTAQAPPSDTIQTSTLPDPSQQEPALPVIPSIPTDTTSFPSTLNDGAMDEFAQTRPPDDLFSDDFEPIPEPVPAPAPVPASVPAPAETQALQKPQRPANAPNQRGGRGRGGLERRGGRGRGGGGTPATQRAAPAKTQAVTTAATAPANADGLEATAQKQEQPASGVQPAAPGGAPEGPRAESVRGDRSGTGGVKKAKLTEEELSARMEAIRLKNASLEAAHARAEADEASFKEREAAAAERRKLERQNRAQMIGEREKNRLRKLRALHGREWDAEKEGKEGGLDSAASAGRGQFRRGAYGGVAPEAARSPGAEGHRSLYVDEAATEDGGYHDRGGYRGRGGRGRGRGRGGRGGFDATPNGQQNPSQTTSQQAVPAASDFPALPPKAEPAAASPSSTAPQSLAPHATPAKGASWAEEMENSPTAATSSEGK